MIRSCMTAKRPSRRSGAARMSVTLPRGTAPASVTSFEEASRVVSDDIARRGWGASQWYGTGAGRILSSGIQVAYVSYNGRVWQGTDDGRTGHVPLYPSGPHSGNEDGVIPRRGDRTDSGTLRLMVAAKKRTSRRSSALRRRYGHTTKATKPAQATQGWHCRNRNCRLWRHDIITKTDAERPRCEQCGRLLFKY